MKRDTLINIGGAFSLFGFGMLLLNILAHFYFEKELYFKIIHSSLSQILGCLIGGLLIFLGKKITFKGGER